MRFPFDKKGFRGTGQELTSKSVNREMKDAQEKIKTQA